MTTTATLDPPALPPVIAQPIAQPTDTRAIAPWPAIDKYGPLVIGPGLSLAYISTIFRLSMGGYRQQYVDLLDEMLEKDPHAFSVLSKRVMGVSGGRLLVTPAKTEAGSLDEELATEIARVTGDMIAAIPALEERLTELAWALYYAIGGEEIHWVRDGRGWMVDRLSLVHSRRLSYPVPGSWDLYVWDQGQALADWGASTPAARFGGFRIADAPGKFIIHAPQIRGGYPTRNGLGRQIAYWMALKLVASRGAPIYLERFARPWPEATYATETTAEKRVASTDDIAKAQAALSAMGAGSLSSWVHPDTITLALRTPDNGSAAKLTFPEWIALCDGQTSKAVSGSTLGTDVGQTGGNRALGETQRKGELQLYKHDAGMLGSTLKRDLVGAIVRLNFPSAPARLYPQIQVHVGEDVDPMVIIERGARGAAAGMPVDADALGKEAGVTLIKPGDTKARRLFPVAAQKAPEQFDEDLAARADAIAKKYPPATTEESTTQPSGDGEDDEDEDTETDNAGQELASTDEPLDEAAEE